MPSQALFDLAIGRQRRALLRILLIVSWGVPPLHLRASKYDEEKIAQEVEGGSQQEHQSPLSYACLKIKTRVNWDSLPYQGQSTHLIDDNLSHDHWCDSTHHVCRTIRNAHQGSGVIRGQIDVVHLEAQIGGSADSHR